LDEGIFSKRGSISSPPENDDRDLQMCRYLSRQETKHHPVEEEKEKDNPWEKDTHPVQQLKKKGAPA
jgi:hypothetical protein